MLLEESLRSLCDVPGAMNQRPLNRLCAVAVSVVVLGCAALDRESTTSSSAGARPPVTPSVAPRPAPPAEVHPAVYETVTDDQAAPPPVRSPGTTGQAAVELQARTVVEAIQLPVVADPEPLAPAPLALDLSQALAMAGGQNPHIALAAARYREAYARLAAARTLWLPSLRVGLSYHHHDGPLQASSGLIDEVSRSSLQTGLGTQAVGAGTTPVPGVVAQFHTRDAVFQPQIAAHAAAARDAARHAATNDTLLAAALVYLELLRATQQLRIAEETRDRAQQLAELTASFARTGQGAQADADRAQTELVRRRNDVTRATETTRVAAARLAELLHLDASVPIQPIETAIVPIDLVAPELPLTELVATGLANRPELAEVQDLVCEAVYRYRREQYAPLVPSVLLGLSQSEFRGGLGSSLGDSGGRFDFDAAVWWELRNFGFGEKANRDETRARWDQTRALQVSVLDRVAREVVEAHAQVQARKQQIAVAESGIQSATDSYERNLARIRQAEGLPIELLQALQALDEARREYLRTLADYNEAQFRLQRALGWPIQ